MKKSTSFTQTAEQKNSLIVVFIAIFTDMIICTMITPILPKYSLSLGVSQTNIGLLFGSYSLALLITTPILGVISDKIGRRQPMILGLFGLAVATILFAFSANFQMLVIARILQGTSAAITWLAGLALLADVFPSEQRGKAMGFAITGQSLGVLIGPTLGGLLFQIGGYRIPFYLATALAIIDGILRICLLKDSRDIKKEKYTSPFSMFKSSKILVVLGAVCVGAVVPSLLEPTLSIHYQEKLSASPSIIGLLFGCSTLSMAIAAPIVGTLSSKFGNAKCTFLGLLLTAIFLPCLLISNSVLLQIPFIMLLGISLGIAIVPCLNNLSDLSEKSGIKSYGVIFGAYNIAYSFGMIIGPMVGSSLVDKLGILEAYILIGLCVLLYSVFFIIKNSYNPNKFTSL
jgi:DHA1 family solute carrier family 18 vesicular amine transporter 1/2